MIFGWASESTALVTSHHGFGVSWPLLASVASASLLGNLHCMGMCGPLVTVYSAAAGRAPGTSRRATTGLESALPHLAYHAARGLMYVLLGVGAGAAGSLVDWAGEAAGIAQVAAWLTSALLILWGIGVLAPGLSIRTPFAGLLQRKLVQLSRKPPVTRASILGALTPFLPCGWLYAFVLVAAGTGGAVSGAVIMAVFWAGTVPGLLGMGALVSRLSTTLRARLPVVTGVLLICVGLFGIASRMAHPLDLTERASHAVPGSQGDGSVSESGHSCH